MKYKVFLDTSILIGSSLFLSVESLGVEIKDVFYDECSRLISIIKNNVNKRIGITTYMVEDEAYQVMSSAIERKLNQKISDRERVFKLLSIAVNLCESRLRNVLSFIVREPVNPVEASIMYIKVAMMYNNLEQRALQLPKPAAMMTDAAPHFLNKAEIFEIYRSQDEILNSQLINLIYNRIEDSDKFILGYAAYLCKLYKETEGKINFFLASTDHHFIPVRQHGFESRKVTDEIENQFGLIADKPQKLFLILKEEYGK